MTLGFERLNGKFGDPTVRTRDRCKTKKLNMNRCDGGDKLTI